MGKHILCLWFDIYCIVCKQSALTTYLFHKGGLGVLWHILWVVIIKSSPDKDRFISKDELAYIQSNASAADENLKSIPWKSLMTSKPVYAITASH